MAKEQVVSMFFDDDGRPIAVGRYGKTVDLLPGEVTPDDPTPPFELYKEYTFSHNTLQLKRASTSNHPTNYWIDVHAEKIGRRVIMDARIYFLEGFYPGDGNDEWWMDLFLEEIKPDFENDISLETVGTYLCDKEPGAARQYGTVYWTRNVGSGKDGIKFYPRLDGEYAKTDHVRISLSWRAKV